jgi:hypothetical protein
MGKSRNIARLIVDATGAVDATNLGNAVPADGSITEAKLASDSVTAAKIATGAVGADELAATAVTAGTYGTASDIPAITVDADGRITGVTTNAVSGGVTSLNGQTGAITNTSLYAIGSYVTGRSANSTSYAVDSTLAGSSLRATSPATTYGTGTTFYYYDNYASTSYAITTVLVNTGTWRCVSPAYDKSPGLWVRIS